jgi:hypothetical protein
MTIAALHRLLEEIDTQGGPDAARHNRLNLPDEGAQPMSTAPAHTTPAAPLVALRPPAAEADPEKVPVGQLLAWGDRHDDTEVQDQAARARAALAGLRQRYTADRELAAITSEREQLQQRLAELQAREQELAPAKAKKPRKSVDYPAAEVRAWAVENGVGCPERGRVPKAVVDAWRQATGSAA